MGEIKLAMHPDGSPVLQGRSGLKRLEPRLIVQLQHVLLSFGGRSGLKRPVLCGDGRARRRSPILPGGSGLNSVRCASASAAVVLLS